MPAYYFHPTSMLTRARFILPFALLAGITVANAQQPAGAARPPRPRTVGQTAYTAKSELFATVPALIVGQPARLGVHLSHLGDRFTPFADGPVTATLTVDGVAATGNVAKPARAGVFRVEVTPTRTGTSTLAIDIAGRDGSDHFVFQNLTVYADVASALAAQGPDPEADAIKYTKEHSWDKNEYASALVAKVKIEGAASPLIAEKWLRFSVQPKRLG